MTTVSQGLNAQQDVEERLRELRPLVVRTVRLVVGSGSAIAEDAAQEALLELGRALPRLRDLQAAPAFAMKIATRVAIKAARRDRRLSLLPVSRATPHADPTMASVELLELKQAFDRLPPRLRATAVLRLYVGLSEAETAEALGCAVGTVKSQLHEARQRLQSQLRVANSIDPEGEAR